jgi:group I intron endonuclease
MHTTPSGKIYVGITGKKPEERWLNGRGYRRNNHFWNAIKKYGWENIRHKILESGLSREEAGLFERWYISAFNSADPAYGYNLTYGGEKGAIHTEESRRKLSESSKGHHRNLGVSFTEERKKHLREHHADVRGEKNPNYGKKWTPEQIAIRQAHRIYKYGSDNPSAKAILQLDMDGNVVKRWGSIVEASQYFCKTSIKDCLRGKYKQHKGYQWRYDNGQRNSDIQL